MTASRESEAIRVLLVDDQELIRTGFALILSTADGIEVVGTAGDGREALALMTRLSAEDREPHVVLMDVRMPHLNGIEATRQIVRDFPHCSVIVLTTFDLDEYAIEAVESGASGFLLKDARASELIAAVRAVAEGDSVMAPSVTQRLLARIRDRAGEASAPQEAPHDSAASTHRSAELLKNLTEREREVLELMADGRSNSEIGSQLFLSESTVKTHVGRILAKLELRDRVHAVIFAYEAGIR